MKDNSRLSKMWENIKNMIKKLWDIIRAIGYYIKSKIMGDIKIPKEVWKACQELSSDVQDNVHELVLYAENDELSGPSKVRLDRINKNIEIINNYNYDECKNFDVVGKTEFIQVIKNVENQITKLEKLADKVERLSPRDDHEGGYKKAKAINMAISLLQRQITVGKFVVSKSQKYQEPKEKAEESFIEWYHNMCIAD
jgi:uncharacterized protein (UPF0147 family)